MSVKVNGQEYKGLAGLLIAIPAMIYAAFLVFMVLVWTLIILGWPFILIGFIVWAVTR